MEYYEPSILRDLGNAIVPVLRIDTHTATETRGRFARLCVQVDLEKPLIKVIKCGGLEHPVQYEGIHSMCFSCGRVGHKVEGCSYKTKALENVGEQVDGKGGEMGEAGKLPEHAEITTEEEVFGLWVLVTRRKQRSKSNKKDKAQVSTFGPAAQNKKGVASFRPFIPGLMDLANSTLRSSEDKRKSPGPLFSKTDVADHTTPPPETFVHGDGSQGLKGESLTNRQKTKLATRGLKGTC